MYKYIIFSSLAFFHFSITVFFLCQCFFGLKDLCEWLISNSFIHLSFFFNINKINEEWIHFSFVNAFIVVRIYKGKDLLNIKVSEVNIWIRSLSQVLVKLFLVKSFIIIKVILNPDFFDFRHNSNISWARSFC